MTDGPWDDIEPTYLPGGDLVFCSTRCHRWIGWWLGGLLGFEFFGEFVVSSIGSIAGVFIGWKIANEYF